jgi:hypothetical protein
MQSVDLNAPLFYSFLGFDREGFIDSVNVARQRSRQLRAEPDTDFDLDTRRRDTSVRQNTTPIPLVSAALSVPRSLRSPTFSTEQQFNLPLPNFQQFNPSSVGFRQTPIDIYA